MTTLLVDIGNTRVKWALLRGSRLGRMHARVHEGDAGAMRALVRSAPRDVTRVVAVSVAGAKLDRALSGAVRARLVCRSSSCVPCGRRPAYAMVTATHGASARIAGWVSSPRMRIARWPARVGRQYWYGADHRCGDA